MRREGKRFMLTDAVVFDALLLGFFLLLACMSLQYNPKARAMPLGIGAIGAAMMLLQLVFDAAPRARSKLRFIVSRGMLGKADVAAVGPEQANGSHQWLRVFRIVFWLIVFTALLGTTYYLVAVGVFTLLLVKVEGREPWRTALLLTASVEVCYYVLFNLILHAQV